MPLGSNPTFSFVKEKRTFFHLLTWTMGAEAALQRLFFCVWQMRVFFDAQDLLSWIRKTTLCQQIGLPFGLVTSWAASTDVTNLNAAQEMS